MLGLVFFIVLEFYFCPGTGSIISVFISNAQLAFTFKAKLTLKFLTEFFEGFNLIASFTSFTPRREVFIISHLWFQWLKVIPNILPQISTTNYEFDYLSII